MLRQLTFLDFNYLLFRCEAEERAESGIGAYEVPNFGPLVYCGLKGIQSVLQRVQQENDLGHPLCGNLRQGTWLIGLFLEREGLRCNELEYCHRSLPFRLYRCSNEPSPVPPPSGLSSPQCLCSPLKSASFLAPLLFWTSLLLFLFVHRRSASSKNFVTDL